MSSLITVSVAQTDPYRIALPRTVPDQRGVALLEFAIVSWVFLFLLFCAYDVSQMIHQYVYLSQATFEAARSASMVQGMTSRAKYDSLPSEKEIAECGFWMKKFDADPPLPCALITAQFRARRVLEIYRPHLIPEHVGMTVHLDDAATIRVESRTHYNALMPLFRWFPITATFRMPYLSLSVKQIGPLREPK